jgi:hypothetical protein
MKHRKLFTLLSLCASTAFAAEINLSSWTVQDYSPGAGNWTVQSGNTSVVQSRNGQPTVFLSDQSALGTDIQGKVKVTTFSDNDFIGFVLGFDNGDFSDPLADYLLIDWKQGNQDVSKVGLAVSRVTGIPPEPGFWGHVNGVTELARGLTLGSTGWVENTDYTFGFVFTQTNLKVTVNGVLQIDLPGSFSGGNFGFYNYSQAFVTYSGFTQDVLPPPPPPNGVPDAGSSAALFALSLVGMGLGARRFLV